MCEFMSLSPHGMSVNHPVLYRAAGWQDRLSKERIKADRQINKQTSRQADKQVGRQAGRPGSQTNRQRGSQKDRQEEGVGSEHGSHFNSTLRSKLHPGTFGYGEDERGDGVCTRASEMNRVHEHVSRNETTTATTRHKRPLSKETSVSLSPGHTAASTRLLHCLSAVLQGRGSRACLDSSLPRSRLSGGAERSPWVASSHPYCRGIRGWFWNAIKHTFSGSSLTVLLPRVKWEPMVYTHTHTHMYM